MADVTPYDQWTSDMVHMATNIMDAWLQHYDWVARAEGLEHTPADDVWDVFTRFRNVDPDAISACIAELSAVELTVASHVNQLEKAKDRVLKYWSGPAAQGFTDYLDDMSTALTNLQDRLQALTAIAQGELQLAGDFQTDVRSLVEKTLKGIEDAEIHQEKMMLAIAGSLAAIPAIVATGGELGPAVVATLTAVTQGAAAVGSEALEGDDVYDVVNAFVRAGFSLTAGCAGQGLGLIAGLDKIMEFVTEDHLPEVRPDRPEIITAPSFDPRSFYPEGADSSKLPSVSTSDLVPEPARHGDQASDHVGGEGKKDITIFGEKVGEYDTGPARDLYPEQGPAA